MNGAPEEGRVERSEWAGTGRASCRGRLGGGSEGEPVGLGPGPSAGASWQCWEHQMRSPVWFAQHPAQTGDFSCSERAPYALGFIQILSGLLTNVPLF